MSLNTTETTPDIIDTFFRVRDKLGVLSLRASTGIPLRTDGRICDGLDRLAAAPILFLRKQCEPFDVFCRGRRIGKSFDFYPDVKLFSAVESPDPTSPYTEQTIPANLLSLNYLDRWSSVSYQNTDDWYIRTTLSLYWMKTSIAGMMFNSRATHIDFQIRKLAIYTEGTHFDWRRDTPASEKQKGTVIVPLGNRSTGGTIILRRHGVETVYPNPQPSKRLSKGDQDIRAVAFDCETEYKMTTVHGGYHFLLYIDILVTEKALLKAPSEKELDEDDEYPENRFPIGWDYAVCGDVMERITECYGERGGSYTSAEDQSTIQKIISMVKKLLQTKYKEVGLALKHLDRERIILPKSLQHPDSILYEALVGCGFFDASLRRVVIYESIDAYGTLQSPVAHQYDETTGKEECGDGTGSNAGRDPTSVVFFYGSVALSKALIETACGEGQPGMRMDTVAGIFLCLKDGASDH